ncbi:MAG: hypothetical protein HY508_05720 [Acidobacteria bacterium]|nr:hypothetical protein [Acidobacteriota bacterium]
MDRRSSLSFGGLNDVFLYELDSFDLPRQFDKDRPRVNRRMAVHWTEQLEEKFKRRDPWLGGIGSKDEAQALLQEGWIEGAQRIKELAERLSMTIPPAKSVRRRMCWSDDGDEVSKDRLNNGLVDSCWRVTKREVATGPGVVTVEANWGGRGNLRSEQLFWQGAAAACLTDILEGAGYRVELYANNYSEHPNGKTLLRIRVKVADSPVRIDTLAAILCHAATFRGLAWWLKNRHRLQ